MSIFLEVLFGLSIAAWIVTFLLSLKIDLRKHSKAVMIATVPTLLYMASYVTGILGLLLKLLGIAI